MFYADLRTNSHYLPVQHSLIRLYNWSAMCLLRGTGWTFKYDSDFSVFKMLVVDWFAHSHYVMNINWTFLIQNETVKMLPVPDVRMDIYLAGVQITSSYLWLGKNWVTEYERLFVDTTRRGIFLSQRAEVRKELRKSHILV